MQKSVFPLARLDLVCPIFNTVNNSKSFICLCWITAKQNNKKGNAELTDVIDYCFIKKKTLQKLNIYKYQSKVCTCSIMKCFFFTLPKRRLRGWPFLLSVYPANDSSYKYGWDTSSKCIIIAHAWEEDWTLTVKGDVRNIGKSLTFFLT